MKTVFLKKYGFHEILRQLIVGDKEFKNIMCAFIKRNLSVVDGNTHLSGSGLHLNLDDDVFAKNNEQVNHRPFIK